MNLQPYVNSDLSTIKRLAIARETDTSSALLAVVQRYRDSQAAAAFAEAGKKRRDDAEILRLATVVATLDEVLAIPDEAGELLAEVLNQLPDEE